MLLTDEQLKRIILENHILTEPQLEEIIKFAKNSNTLLYEALIEKNVITDEDLGKMTADFLKIPFVNLTKTQVPEEAFHIIPERIARRQKVVAFARDENGVKLAMADPKNTLVQ